MASWLVSSSPDRSDPVSSPGACFSKIPGEKFSRPESRGIISNLIMITELFYLHILSKTRSSLRTRFFRSIHCSVFRYRFTKIWLYRPENVPLVGDTALCSWARHCTLTVPLSTQVYKWLLVNCWGNLKNCGEMTCDGVASRPGGIEIFLVDSRYSNRDELRLDGPLGSYADFTLSLTRVIYIIIVCGELRILT